MDIRRLHEDLKISLDKIPEDITIYNNEMLKKFIISNIKKDFSVGKNTLNWNFLKVLKNVGFDTKLVLNNKQAYILLDDTQIAIKKQNYFHFIFINKLKSLSKKHDFLKQYFYKKELGGYMTNLIKVEDEVCIKKKDKYYIDFTIDIKNYYICIEFFEKNTHYNKDDNELKSDKSRALQILDNDKFIDKNCVYFAVFWDFQLEDSNNINLFVKKIIEKIGDYHYLDNVKYWTIMKMNEYINNESFNEMIYDSHENKNQPIVSIPNLIEQKLRFLFRDDSIKDKLLLEFEKYINFLDKKMDEDCLDSIEDSDAFESISPLLEKQIYYDKKSDKITWYGLHILLHLIKLQWCKDTFSHYEIVEFYEKMACGFIDGLKQQYNKLKDLTNEKIYGF